MATFLIPAFPDHLPPHKDPRIELPRAPHSKT
jgi:hypothetical protein